MRSCFTGMHCYIRLWGVRFIICRVMGGRMWLAIYGYRCIV